MMNNKGFTLIELIVGITVLIIGIGATYLYAQPNEDDTLELSDITPTPVIKTDSMDYIQLLEEIEDSFIEIEFEKLIDPLIIEYYIDQNTIEQFTGAAKVALVNDAISTTTVDQIAEFLETKGFEMSDNNVAGPDHGGYIIGLDDKNTACKVQVGYTGYLGELGVDQELMVACGFLPY